MPSKCFGGATECYSKEVLNSLAQKGKIINIFKVMANSSAVLKTYFAINKTLKKKTLSNEIAERIAVQIAEINGCEYCLAAHSYISSKAGISDEEIKLSTCGKSKDLKIQAALDFAGSVMKNAGKVSDAEFEKIKAAGFSDGEILEIAAEVALNFFTNIINNISHTKVDFPKPKE